MPGVIRPTASARLPKSADRMDGATRRVGAPVGAGVSTVAIAAEPTGPRLRTPGGRRARDAPRAASPTASIGRLPSGWTRRGAAAASRPRRRPRRRPAVPGASGGDRRPVAVGVPGRQHPQALPPERRPGPAEPHHPAQLRRRAGPSRARARGRGSSRRRSGCRPGRAGTGRPARPPARCSSSRRQPMSTRRARSSSTDSSGSMAVATSA